MLQTIDIRITGVSPILLHSTRCMDPTLPLARAMKEISSKRKKTDTDLEEMARLEWELGLYPSVEGDDSAHVIIPPEMFKASLRDGAKDSKKGQDVNRAVMVSGPAKLEYKGPKTIGALRDKWSDFMHRSTVVVQRSRVFRARPMFPVPWSAVFSVEYFEDVVNPGDLLRYAETAGRLRGLGDYRPDKGGIYGRFTAEEA